MKILRITSNLLALAVLALGFTSMANAQATRTWVSGVGDDANPCSRTAPCKTFAGAISKTASGGEIDCLDPGGFGTLTITKAITIDCDSGAGGVLSSGTFGITINAPTTDVVIIRNLQVSGAGVTLGTTGINVIAAKAVFLEDVWVQQYSGAGVNVGINQSADIQVMLQDCNIAQTAVGVQVANAGTGHANVTIHDTRIQNSSSNAVGAGNGSIILVKDSQIQGSPIGVIESGLGGQGATVTVSNSSFQNITGNALQATGGGAILSFANAFINVGGVAFFLGGGSIFTGGDNFIAGGGTGAATGPAARF